MKPVSDRGLVANEVPQTVVMSYEELTQRLEQCGAQLQQDILVEGMGEVVGPHEGYYVEGTHGTIRHGDGGLA